jgi:hypothetical protein
MHHEANTYFAFIKIEGIFNGDGICKGFNIVIGADIREGPVFSF